MSGSIANIDGTCEPVIGPRQVSSIFTMNPGLQCHLWWSQGGTQRAPQRTPNKHKKWNSKKWILSWDTVYKPVVEKGAAPPRHSEPFLERLGGLIWDHPGTPKSVLGGPEPKKRLSRLIFIEKTTLSRDLSSWVEIGGPEEPGMRTLSLLSQCQVPSQISMEPVNP